MVYLPAPRPEPTPNITINNYYVGDKYSGPSRNRGHSRGKYRSARVPPTPAQITNQPLKILTQAEIQALSRGQKRRYYKNLASHSSNDPASQ